jgi:hypothetical protein
VVPSLAFSLFSADEIALSVCGRRQVDLALLKSITRIEFSHVNRQTHNLSDAEVATKLSECRQLMVIAEKEVCLYQNFSLLIFEYVSR